MLDLAFSNIRRQKTRTGITIIGILIGIGAIVILGSISEGLSVMMQKNLELIAGKIMVFEGESSEGLAGMMSGMMTSEITDDHIDTLNNINGVKEAIPMLWLMGDSSGGFFSMEWQGIGLDPEKLDYFKGENVLMYDGRPLEEGDTEVVIIGKDVADRYELVIGDYFTMQDEDYEIIGIVEKTDVQDIDLGVILPIEDMKDLLETETYQMAYVIPEDVADVEAISDTIQEENEDLYTVSSKDIARQASQMLSQISFFTIGIGAVAAIVGGLGVMNTMIMAVMERRREIGVLKAIGATNNMILKQFLTESAMITLIGGFVALALGFIGVLALSALSSGMLSPVVTPALATGALIFALLLGIVGGLYPAWKAAKLDPVEALRYE